MKDYGGRRMSQSLKHIAKLYEWIVKREQFKIKEMKTGERLIVVGNILYNKHLQQGLTMGSQYVEG